MSDRQKAELAAIGPNAQHAVESWVNLQWAGFFAKWGMAFFIGIVIVYFTKRGKTKN